MLYEPGRMQNGNIEEVCFVAYQKIDKWTYSLPVMSLEFEHQQATPAGCCWFSTSVLPVPSWSCWIHGDKCVQTSPRADRLWVAPLHFGEYLCGAHGQNHQQQAGISGVGGLGRKQPIDILLRFITTGWKSFKVFWTVPEVWRFQSCVDSSSSHNLYLSGGCANIASYDQGLEAQGFLDLQHSAAFADVVQFVSLARWPACIRRKGALFSVADGSVSSIFFI